MVCQPFRAKDNPYMTTTPPLSDADAPPLATAIELLRQGKWEEGRVMAAKAAVTGAEPDARLRLLLAVADIRTGRSLVAELASQVITAADLGDLRHLLVSPLRKDGAIAEAIFVLDIIIAGFPPAVPDLRQRSSLRARLLDWPGAISDADMVASLSPDDPVAAVQRLQYRLQAGRSGEAAALVTEIVAGIVAAQRELPEDNRLLAFMLLALLREKQFSAAGALAQQIKPAEVSDPALAGAIVQALFRAGNHSAAIAIGEDLLASGLDGVMLRSHLAQAWLEGGTLHTRAAKAIPHLEAGVALAPDDLRMVSLLGAQLLRAGKTEAAIPHLRKAVEQQPQMGQIRALYARALKQVGRHAEAADAFVTMLASAPDEGTRWHRYAAGALAQAGRREEAADMFDAWVDRRRAALPESFSEGLDALWDRLGEAKLPQARLDWAWSLRGPDCTLDRAEWDRRAKWGHLADHFLLDWLECRDAQVEEAMHHFADDLDFLERFTAEARARAPGKGVVYASAHVGAMYFGPLSLELIGERSRWVASTPSIARTSYSETLISTSDQTETQVVRAFMQALKQDCIVVIVADGAINLAAPRIAFEGQEVTYSQFAARTAFRMGAPSAFVSPVWRPDNHLGFVLEHLPMPDAGETADAYADRWQTAYLGHLRRFIAGNPENLRLSGGIWRHIR